MVGANINNSELTADSSCTSSNGETYIVTLDSDGTFQPPNNFLGIASKIDCISLF